MKMALCDRIYVLNRCRDQPMEFQMSADWSFHCILGTEMALHFSKTKAMSLSKRRNFRRKFVFEEGTLPTSPTSKRRRTDEEEENERKDEEPEPLAEKVEVEGEEEANQADDEDSDDEDLNSLTFCGGMCVRSFSSTLPRAC